MRERCLGILESDRITLIEEPFDQPLRIALVKDKPMGYDHVLKQRATEHRCLRGQLRIDEYSDRVERAVRAPRGTEHELLQLRVDDVLALGQVVRDPTTRLHLIGNRWRIPCGGVGHGLLARRDPKADTRAILAPRPATPGG